MRRSLPTERTTTSPRVEADPDLDLHPVRAVRVVRVALQRLLHPQLRVARPHRVILMGERRAEEGHDPVTHHLIDGSPDHRHEQHAAEAVFLLPGNEPKHGGDVRHVHDPPFKDRASREVIVDGSAREPAAVGLEIAELVDATGRRGNSFYGRRSPHHFRHPVGAIQNARLFLEIDGQQENAPGQEFCGECGARLAVACASSGVANPPRQKFCGECGAGLMPAAMTKSASPESHTPKHLAEKIL